MVWVAIGLAVILLVVVFSMLLRRQLREKYAVLWLVIGFVVLILGVFPQLLGWMTTTLGVQVPSNLLFTLAILLLLAVGLHLSWELSLSEDEVRRVAEETALSRAEADRLRGRIAELEAAVFGGNASKNSQSSPTAP